MSIDCNSEQFNAVEAAIRQVGGIKSCARLLQVSERLLYLWCRRGNLRGVAAEKVLLLARESGIAPENLVGRIGGRKWGELTARA